MTEKIAKIDQFIGVYDNYIPPPLIDQATKQFLESERVKRVYDRQTAEHARLSDKQDLAINIEAATLNGWWRDYSLLIDAFREPLQHYFDNTGILEQYNNIGDLDFGTVKLQKTKPSQGYHVWHIEHSFGIEMASRVLAFTIYLNNVEEGGETEFLHQKMRVKPVKGRCVIWPATFPYVHRGNPPISNDKYIMTSWLLIRGSAKHYGL
tara:strand:+ start:721 stop:1344 length:624 start_codon:yes stop_codon:yes gene_type:complete